MQFKYSFKRIFVGIQEYTTRIYLKYGNWLTICGTCRTSIAVNTHLTKSICPSTDGKTQFMSSILYREVVGDLLWCSLVCRLDLFYTVN